MPEVRGQVTCRPGSVHTRPGTGSLAAPSPLPPARDGARAGLCSQHTGPRVLCHNILWNLPGPELVGILTLTLLDKLIFRNFTT